MTSHRPPPPARTPRVVWVIAFGAAVGIVGPPIVALAQTVAPQVAAQTALAFPEQTPEPVGHGGLGGPLVIPSIGASGAWEPDATTETPTRRPSFVVTEPRNTLRATPSRPTATGQTPTGAPSPTPAAAIAIPETATPPTPTTDATTTAGSTVTTPPTTTTPATTDAPAPTTQEATTTSAATTDTSAATTSSASDEP